MLHWFNKNQTLETEKRLEIMGRTSKMQELVGMTTNPGFDKILLSCKYSSSPWGVCVFPLKIQPSVHPLAVVRSHISGQGYAKN